VKKLIIILALSLFLKPIFPVIEYVVNYQYISKVLCVNKAKPMMHCNGKCHLMKELAKAAENEKPISSDKKHATAETNDLFFNAFQKFECVYLYSDTTSKINSRYSNLYARLNSDSVFHPPTFSI